MRNIISTLIFLFILTRLSGQTDQANLKITHLTGEGHTKDNIVIWFDIEKILYCGCFVKSTESIELGNIVDANTSQSHKLKTIC